MKIRLGMVSNSSSSSWIFVVNQKTSKKIEKSVIEGLITHMNYTFFQNERYDNIKSYDDEFISIVQNSCHELPNPKNWKKWSNFVPDNNQYDIETFLISIGMKTYNHPQNEKKLKAYEKIYTQIKKMGWKGFYIILGSDVEELPIGLSEQLELYLKLIIRYKGKIQSILNNFQIYLCEPNP